MSVRLRRTVEALRTALKRLKSQLSAFSAIGEGWLIGAFRFYSAIDQRHVVFFGIGGFKQSASPRENRSLKQYRSRLGLA